ncbi:MAG: hypothetical protein Sylvanvirus7_1, partial [Sylvanvirus sp.]
FHRKLVWLKFNDALPIYKMDGGQFYDITTASSKLKVTSRNWKKTRMSRIGTDVCETFLI